MKGKSLSHVRLFVTPWTIALQAPLSMGFPRQEYWSGLPFPSPEDLLDPGIKPGSPALQADSLPSACSKTTRNAQQEFIVSQFWRQEFQVSTGLVPSEGCEERRCTWPLSLAHRWPSPCVFLHISFPLTCVSVPICPLFIRTQSY